MFHPFLLFWLELQRQLARGGAYGPSHILQSLFDSATAEQSWSLVLVMLLTTAAPYANSPLPIPPSTYLLSRNPGAGGKIKPPKRGIGGDSIGSFVGIIRPPRPPSLA